MAVGGVRTVQRPTVSRTAGDPAPALSFQREDSIPQKLQLCQDCSVSQSTWYFSTQCPCLPAVMGKRGSHKSFIGCLDCFSTPANQPYSFFRLCHGPTASQGVCCCANCKRQLTNLSWQSCAF